MVWKKERREERTQVIQMHCLDVRPKRSVTRWWNAQERKLLSAYIQGGNMEMVKESRRHNSSNTWKMNSEGKEASQQ